MSMFIVVGAERVSATPDLPASRDYRCWNNRRSVSDRLYVGGKATGIKQASDEWLGAEFVIAVPTTFRCGNMVC